MERSPAPGPPAEVSIGRFLLVGGGGVVLAQMLGLLSGMGGQMLMARLISPEALGAYFLTVSVVEVAGNLVQLGLPRPVTRLIAEAVGRGSRAEARGVPLAAMLPCAAAAVLLVTQYLWVGEWLALSAFGSALMASGTGIAALWIVGASLSELVSGALRGFRRVGLAAFTANALSRVALVIVLAALFVSGRGVGFVPLLGIVAACVWLGPLVGGLVLRGELRGERTRPPVQLLLAASLPLLATGLAHNLYMRADIWLIGGFFGEDAVALYGAAKRLIVLVTLPLMALTLAVPPIVAELHARGDIERLQRAVRGAATLAGLPAIALLLTLALASEPVLGLAYGEYYRAGARVLTILSVERFVFLWVGPCGMVLTMTGHERTLMKITVLAGALSVAGVYVGSQLAGMSGAAAGFAVGAIVNHLSVWQAVRRRTGMRTDIDLFHLDAALDAVRRAFGR